MSQTREEGQQPGKRELSSLGKPRDFHPGCLLPRKREKEPTHLSGSSRKRGHLFSAWEELRIKEETGVLLVGGLGVAGACKLESRSSQEGPEGVAA